ncbi:hypothetical protein Gohar_004435 [Gossypium harknessii]|nr:hypothetical protein [Gossypium harknessii]
MVIYLIYSMSRWISTCSELWHNIGIRPIAVLLLKGRFGAHCRRVHNFTLLSDDPSRQSLF